MCKWSFFGTPSLALFPEWYHSVRDLTPIGVLQGDFVFARTDESAPLPQDVTEFLQAGESPIVFTFGTGVGHVREVFTKAVAALVNTGKRGILVTKFSKNLPEDLRNVLTIPYADFSALLPRASLVVHHGGVGTAAQALQAGIPQVIVPLAFDQPDNAHRFKSLGLAECLPDMKFSIPDLEYAILRAFEGISSEKLNEIRKDLLRSDGRSSAANHCEHFFAKADDNYAWPAT